MKDPDIVALLQRQTELKLKLDALHKDIERASCRAACRKRWQRATGELLEQLQTLAALGEPPADEPLELVAWRHLRTCLDAVWNALEECKERNGP